MRFWLIGPRIRSLGGIRPGVSFGPEDLRRANRRTSTPVDSRPRPAGLVALLWTVFLVGAVTFFEIMLMPIPVSDLVIPNLILFVIVFLSVRWSIRANL